MGYFIIFQERVKKKLLKIPAVKILHGGSSPKAEHLCCNKQVFLSFLGCRPYNTWTSPNLLLEVLLRTDGYKLVPQKVI